MASLIGFFVDDPAVTFRTAEVPNANWNSGAFGAFCANPGVGISTENPGLDESLPNWTLLDQFGNARNAQRSQCIGGPGFVDRTVVDWPSSGGQEGTLPASVVRLYDQANLPTNAEKDLFADSPAPTVLDGNLTLPANGADLLDLAVGWEDAL